MDIIIRYLNGNYDSNDSYYNVLEKIDRRLLNHLSDKYIYMKKRKMDVLLEACRNYASLARNIPKKMEFVKVQYPDRMRVQYISYGRHNDFYDYYFVFHLHDPRIQTPIMNYSFKPTPISNSYYRNASDIRYIARFIRDPYHRNVFCDYYIKNNVKCPAHIMEKLIKKYETEELFYKHFKLYNSEFVTLEDLQAFDAKKQRSTTDDKS